MENMPTLTESINRLRKEGYTVDFNLKQNGLECLKEGIMLAADQFQIDEVSRFEGMSDPADETVLYAVSSADGTCKGVLVDAYGSVCRTNKR